MPVSPCYLNKLIIVFTILKAAGAERLKIKIIKIEMCNKNLEKIWIMFYMILE
jgi:hypothetical protein